MNFFTCCRSARFAWAAIALLASIDASAQTVPTIDTEDATLGSAGMHDQDGVYHAYRACRRPARSRGSRSVPRIVG